MVLNGKPKTIKISKVNKGTNICYLGLGKGFVRDNPKREKLYSVEI